MTKENVPVKQYHTESILDGVRLTAEQKKTITDNKLTIFADMEYFDTKVFPADYDCLIFNPRMDYIQIIYEHKTENFRIPAGGFDNDYLNPKDQDGMLRSLQVRNVPGINNDFFTQFEQNFKSLGRITPDKFINNLQEIRKLTPVRIPIIFINQPELESTKNQSPEVFERIPVMNQAIEKFISESENCHLLDIRRFVYHESHLESDISQFKRKYYRDISLELLNKLNTLLPKKVNTRFNLKSIIFDRGYALYEDAKILKQKILGKNTKRQIKALLKVFSSNS